GPALEPVRVLHQPGMVRRALDRDIERDLEMMRLARGNQVAEILKRAEFGMDGVVAASRRSDRVRTAGVARCYCQRVVATLAVGGADWMNGCEIENIETHRSDVGQPPDAVLEGAMAA